MTNVVNKRDIQRDLRAFRKTGLGAHTEQCLEFLNIPGSHTLSWVST